MREAFISAAVVGALATFSLPAAAQAPESGFYGGVSLGQAKVRDACDGLPAGFTCDDKDSAWRLFGGWQVNRTFAAEAGYANLGNVSSSGPGVSASAESRAWDLVGVAGMPVGPVTLFGKAGAYHSSTDVSSTVGNASDAKTGLTFGAGAKYDFTRNLAARAEWQRYNNVGGQNVGTTDVDFLNVGLQYTFR